MPRNLKGSELEPDVYLLGHDNDIHTHEGNTKSQKLTNNSDDTDWEDEEKWLALLRNSNDDTIDQDGIADKLQTAFDCAGGVCREEYAQENLPAIKRVKDIHMQLENEVDPEIASGITRFEAVCLRRERDAIAEEEKVKEAYNVLKHTVTRIMEQLKTAYEEREKLWDEFIMEFDAIAESTLSELDGLPEDVDKIHLSMEKKAKAAWKAETNAASKRERRLREFLAAD